MSSVRFAAWHRTPDNGEGQKVGRCKHQGPTLFHLCVFPLNITQRLGENTVKQFEELARNFAEQDTIEDIVNWGQYLSKQLKDEQLIHEYNAWSEEYFKPLPRASVAFNDFRSGLCNADWNAGNRSLDVVSSMMLYGRRLQNQGLFVLGTLQKFWLRPPFYPCHSVRRGVATCHNLVAYLLLAHRSYDFYERKSEKLAGTSQFAGTPAAATLATGTSAAGAS